MNGFEQMAVRFPDPYRLLWREKVGSTNDELRILAEQGLGAGMVMVAEEQFAGRGRRGAEWFSQSGESLAFSILLRPSAERALWPRFSLVAGLAVAEALEAHLPMVDIKWPNDVIIGGKKVAGILVEAGRDYVIVGIGINVNTENFPEGLMATSLYLESGRKTLREEVLLGVIERLSAHVQMVEVGFESLVEAVNQRCFLRGHRVEMKCADGIRVGRVVRIGGGGELLVETAGRVEAIVQAHEVRIVEEIPV